MSALKSGFDVSLSSIMSMSSPHIYRQDSANDFANEKNEKGDATSVRDHPVELTENLYTNDAVDPIYQAKARILNDALQEIGMGKYQASEAYISVYVRRFI